MNKNKIIAQSPGRINIIGEHTDYNDGFVLPAAINKKSVFKLSKNGSDQTVNIRSEDFGNSYSFSLTDLKPLKSGWENYVMGVINELQKSGAHLEGFDGEFGGDVPIGSGMSSSAALECSLAFGLNELFDLGFDNWQIIKICQLAEHNFAGIKCGIMDQFASVMGKKDHAMLLDCRSLEYKFFPLELGKYEFLLMNTNVSHTLASSEYNTRRIECEKGVEIIRSKFPNIKNLRDATLEMLTHCTSELPEPIFKRCHHIITENERVLNATDALTKKDFHLLGKLMYQSHLSLQTKYEVSCQELDFLVDITQENPHVLGSRMMGGGFGGCTINLILRNERASFVDHASTAYRKQYGIDLKDYSVQISDGSKIIS